MFYKKRPKRVMHGYCVRHFPGNVKSFLDGIPEIVFRRQNRLIAWILDFLNVVQAVPWKLIRSTHDKENLFDSHMYIYYYPYHVKRGLMSNISYTLQIEFSSEKKAGWIYCHLYMNDFNQCLFNYIIAMVLFWINYEWARINFSYVLLFSWRLSHIKPIFIFLFFKLISVSLWMNDIFFRKIFISDKILLSNGWTWKEASGLATKVKVYCPFVVSHQYQGMKILNRSAG